MKTIVTGLLLLLGIGTAALATSPYAGQETREISSLSTQDVADLLAGRGWGLAKPAELNGYPGPQHVLDLADALDLEAEQEAAVRAIFQRMQLAAREAGAAYVAAERKLDLAFRARTVDDVQLAARLAETERLRGELRRIHLKAHLETTPILTPQQRHLYARLRAYHGGQPH